MRAESSVRARATPAAAATRGRLVIAIGLRPRAHLAPPLTAPAVLAGVGVGSRVRRLPLSSRRLSSVAGRPKVAPKAPEPRASPCVLG